MPLRVNMAGVIPVIFAAALLALPQTLGSFLPSTQNFINAHFSPRSWTYLIVEALPDHHLHVLLHGGAVQPGRPGGRAAQVRRLHPGHPARARRPRVYLDRVLTRLTLPGSLYLATVAVLPSIFINYFNFSQATSRALGGTSVLIVVGVALDTMRQMESQMMMRSYEGFLRSEPARAGPAGGGQGDAGQADRSRLRDPARLDRRHVPRRDRARRPSSGGRSSRSSRAGALVPDEITIALIRERLAERRRARRLRARRLPAQRGAGRRARRDARRDRAPARRDPLLRPSRRRRDRADARARGGARAAPTTRPR